MEFFLLYGLSLCIGLGFTVVYFVFAVWTESIILVGLEFTVPFLVLAV